MIYAEESDLIKPVFDSNRFARTIMTVGLRSGIKPPSNATAAIVRIPQTVGFALKDACTDVIIDGRFYPTTADRIHDLAGIAFEIVRRVIEHADSAAVRAARARLAAALDDEPTAGLRAPFAYADLDALTEQVNRDLRAIPGAPQRTVSCAAALGAQIALLSQLSPAELATATGGVVVGEQVIFI